MIRRYRRDELENQLNRGALWAITYGDLMSYLMIFFLVLFSLSLTKTPHGKSQRKYDETLANIQKVFGGKATAAPPTAEELARRREENLAKRISEQIQAKQLGEYAAVIATEEKVRIELKEPILFDSGHAELKPEAFPILKDVADGLKSLPNEIVIEGHTDTVPIRGGRYSSNWELSMARAYAVIRFFESAGVDPKRLSGAGYGEHRPAADNKTAEGRAKNRRIGITLIRAQ